MGGRKQRKQLRDIWRVLESGELCALQAITPGEFDWAAATAVSPVSGATPLQEVVSSVAGETDSFDGFKSVAKWLLDHGACPIQMADEDACGFDMWGHGDRRRPLISVERKTRSALSLALEIRAELHQSESTQNVDWQDEITFLSELVVIFSKVERSHGTCNRMSVSTSVVDRWGMMLQDPDQNLTIRASDGACTVHANMLRIASPVVSASLSSAMQEGSSKSIDVDGCPLAALHFFVELVYTGGSSENVTASVAIHALELAHRWQVDDVVSMVEKALIGLLEVDTFEETASTAQLLNLPKLKHACVSFARQSSVIQQQMQSKALPKSVMKLLGSLAGDEQPPKKLRRML